MKKLLLLKVFITLMALTCFSRKGYATETGPFLKVEPPCWWSGMDYDTIQLLVYGENIAFAQVSMKSDKVIIKDIHRAENPNYLFIDIHISPDAKPGEYPIEVKTKKGIEVITFELLPRQTSSNRWQGFDSRDAIYLLMPDRFANGDTDNDNQQGMLEMADRSNPDGRHGGDIQGIHQHLDYIRDMGFTALWINPLIENDRPAYSYHGYGITDFYRVDPRFGTNEEYAELVGEAHSKGLKVIMDMVFNHCDTSHYTVSNPPFPDWVNTWDTYTRSNFRAEVKIDPYASDSDIQHMSRGWFDTFMADLNQDNPFVLRYLVQNSIWWIEYLGIDAIRMDTYPYPEKEAMAEWAETIRRLYPEFTILGETWLQKTAHTAYWQARDDNYDGYNSHVPVITDFPLHYATVQGLNETEGWTQGLRRWYYTLSEDFLYDQPQNLVVFPDNHDVNRYYTSLKEDIRHYKMGLAFLLTIPRIPEIYYGTEILMTGEEHKGHGYIREDFPGGWRGDSVSAFTGQGLSAEQKEAQTFLKTLLNWRKSQPVIHNGHFKHFIPEDDVYVYFRYFETDCVMVIINASEESRTLGADRFREVTGDYSVGVDVLNGDIYHLAKDMKLPSKTALILELKN